MPGASNLQSSFLGGELSQSYQGRYDRPDYKTSLALCLNSYPIETGAWVRRGGTQFCGTTRGGNPGRVIDFSVKGANPIDLEFTDLFLRFRSGATLISTNAPQAVSAISAANPAVVTVPTAPATGASGFFTGLGTNNPLLQNRIFTVTNVSGTTFSLQDAITGANIDGSTLGSFVSGTWNQVLELTTNYGAGSWASLRSVQAETQAVLLNGTHPQVLTMTAAPTPIANPTFALAPSNFLDGPYLDPFPGSICTYNVLSGNVTLTFTFLAWSSTTSYNVGDFVTSGGQGYQSIAAANLNHIPPNASFWKPVNGGAPVGPNGFTAADIGRHIRLFSEPPAWNSSTAYTVTTPATIVKYNDSYYAATASSTNVPPGTDATKWAVVSGAAFAVWTWGRILSVSGSGLINPSLAIGNYTSLASAFDGNTVKGAASSANSSVSAATYPQWSGAPDSYSSGDGVFYSGNLYQANVSFAPWQPIAYAAHSYVSYGGSYWTNGAFTISTAIVPPNSPWTNVGPDNPANATIWTSLGAASSVSLDIYAGQDFHTSPKAIAYATVFPSTDKGFGSNLPTGGVTFNLRGKHSAPASASDGTIIGTSGAVSNGFASITITSTDTATTWEYVWVEMTATQTPPLADNGSHTFTMSAYLAQSEFFAANVSNGSVVTIQLAGPPLLYANTTPINTWRAGVYSDGAGWPTCGTYSDGRLWLGGVVDNRFDASMSNNIFTFSPTGPDGTVADNNGISYTLNAPDVNPILWMVPDQQGIVMGTQKREWLVSVASTASGLAPGNIQGRPITHIGCANIEPRRTEHTLAFVQKHQRKILEAFPDVFSGRFTAPNLMEKARHLTGPLVAEIGYTQELTPIIWARCGDGSWFGLTYKRDTLMTSQGPTFVAPHHHVLGSGRIVESIAVSPSPDGTLDSLMMVTNDRSGIRHVELLTEYFEETDALAAAWQLDDAVAPTSTTLNSSPAPYGGLTINGLWHLNGKTVQVFAGGLDCGLQEGGTYTDLTVSNGSVTVPFGDGVSAGSAAGQFTAAFVQSFPAGIPIVVGFTFNSDGQRVRPIEPAESGSRNGPALGDKRRNHKYAIQIVQATGLSIGTSFSNLDAVQPETDMAEKLPLGTLFSGVHRDAIDDVYGFDGQICWRISRPWPAMITAVTGKLETQDE